MKLIEIVEAKASNGDRRRKIDAWIKAILAAEAAARGKAVSDKRIKPRHFLVNYRVASETSSVKGTDDQRRSALIEIIEALKPVEKHLSTSTWLIRLYMQEASEIRDLLTGPLDAGLDGLHVTYASNTNRAAFGTTGLR